MNKATLEQRVTDGGSFYFTPSTKAFFGSKLIGRVHEVDERTYIVAERVDNYDRTAYLYRVLLVRFTPNEDGGESADVARQMDPAEGEIQEYPTAGHANRAAQRLAQFGWGAVARF